MRQAAPRVVSFFNKKIVHWEKIFNFSKNVGNKLNELTSIPITVLKRWVWTLILLLRSWSLKSLTNSAQVTEQFFHVPRHMPFWFHPLEILHDEGREDNGINNGLYATDYALVIKGSSSKKLYLITDHQKIKWLGWRYSAYRWGQALGKN